MKGKRIVCIMLAALLLLLLCLGRVFAPYDPAEVHMADRMKGPSAEYPMGTDQLGRDLLSRILYASTTSTFIAVKANINNVTYSERDNIFEVDPDLAEYLLDTIRQFERPTRR